MKKKASAEAKAAKKATSRVKMPGEMLSGATPSPEPVKKPEPVAKEEQRWAWWLVWRRRGQEGSYTRA